jgi:hypothetical protein
MKPHHTTKLSATSTRHHGHPVTIVIFPMHPSQGLQDRDNDVRSFKKGQ